MKEPSAREERSKEEILASIRKVVSEQAEGRQTSEADQQDDSGILDLTQEIRDDGSVVDIETGATVVDTEPDEPEPDETEPDRSEDRLVGEEAETASTAAFAAVAQTAAERLSLRETDSKTIEAAAKEVMLPMIKEWLDANLPEIVERLVQREIERLSRRGESFTGR